MRTINKEVKERKEQLAKLKDDMQKYQALVDNEPPEVNTDDINSQIVRPSTYLLHESICRVSHLTDLVCVRTQTAQENHGEERDR